MASIQSLQNENAHLENLINSLKQTADRLYYAANDVSKIGNNLDKNYSLNNNSSYAIGSINSLKNDILNERDYILTGLIVDIRNQISSNESEIRTLQEEERRRQEEQERQEREEREREERERQEKAKKSSGKK